MVSCYLKGITAAVYILAIPSPFVFLPESRAALIGRGRAWAYSRKASRYLPKTAVKNK